MTGKWEEEEKNNIKWPMSFFSVIQEEWTPGEETQAKQRKKIFSKDRPGFKYVSISFVFSRMVGFCLVFYFFWYVTHYLSPHRHLFWLISRVLLLLFFCFFKSVCPCRSNRPAVVVTASVCGMSLAVVAWRLPVPVGCNVSTCLAQWVRDRQL